MRQIGDYATESPNKTMHKTKPERGSFDIIARHKRLGGCVSFLLSLRARVRLVIVGVRADTLI